MLEIGVKPEKIGYALNELLLFALEDGARNDRDVLIKRAEKFFREKSER